MLKNPETPIINESTGKWKGVCFLRIADFYRDVLNVQDGQKKSLKTKFLLKQKTSLQKKFLKMMKSFLKKSLY